MGSSARFYIILPDGNLSRKNRAFPLWEAMIAFDGASGGLGRYLGPVLDVRSRAYAVFQTRLEDHSGFTAELHSRVPANPPGSAISFLQLAAKVSVPDCEKNPEAAFQTNVVNRVARARVFIRWARANKLRPRLLYVSTAHLYASAQPPHRIREEDPIAPRSVYAKTKYEAEVALRELGKSEQVDVLIARVFGLLAPAQPPGYVLSGLIRRLREKDTSPIPGLKNVRDYLDARDICAHLTDLAALETWPANLLVNVCAGEPIAIADLWTLLVKAVPEAHTLPPAREAPGRPDDIPWIVGDPERLVKFLGHAPRLTPLTQTLHDALKK